MSDETRTLVAPTGSGTPTRNVLGLPVQLKVFFHWPDSKENDEGFLGSPLQAVHAPFIATRIPRSFHQTFQTQDRTSQSFSLTGINAVGVRGTAIAVRSQSSNLDNVHLVLPEHCFVIFQRSPGSLRWKRRIYYDVIEGPDSRLYSIPLRVRQRQVQIQEPPAARRHRGEHRPASSAPSYAANDTWYDTTTPLDNDGWVQPLTGAELHLLCLAIIPYGGSEDLSVVLRRSALNDTQQAHGPIIVLRDAIIPYVTGERASYNPRVWEHRPEPGDPHRAQDDEYPRFDKHDLELHRPLSEDELNTVQDHHRAPSEFLRFPPDKPTDPNAPQTYTSVAPCFGLEPLRFVEATLHSNSAHVEPHIPLPQSDFLIALELINQVFATDSENTNERQFLEIVTGFIPPKHIVEALSSRPWPRINQIRHIFGDAVDLRPAGENSFDTARRADAIHRLVPFPGDLEFVAEQARHHFDRLNWERILIASDADTTQPRQVLHADVRGYQLPALAGVFESDAGRILVEDKVARRRALTDARCNIVDIIAAGSFNTAQGIRFLAHYDSSVLRDRPGTATELDTLFTSCENDINGRIYLTLNVIAPSGTTANTLKVVIVELFLKFGREGGPDFKRNFLGVTIDLERIATNINSSTIRNILLEITQMLAGFRPWPSAGDISAMGVLQPGKTWIHPGGIRAMPERYLIPIFFVARMSGAIPWNEVPALNDVIVPLGYGRAGDSGPNDVNSILSTIHESRLMNKTLTGNERDISVRDLATYPNLPGPHGDGIHFTREQVAPHRLPLITWWAETARLYGANLLLYHFSKWNTYNYAEWAPELSNVLPRITTIRRSRDTWSA